MILAQIEALAKNVPHHQTADSVKRLGRAYLVMHLVRPHLFALFSPGVIMNLAAQICALQIWIAVAVYPLEAVDGVNRASDAVLRLPLEKSRRMGFVALGGTTVMGAVLTHALGLALVNHAQLGMGAVVGVWVQHRAFPTGSLVLVLW